MILIPYAEVNGCRSVPDTVLHQIWDLMVKENTYKSVFFHGSVQNKEQFVKWLKDPSNVFCFQFDGKEPVSMCWLNDIKHNHALAHFCYFKKYWGQSTELIKIVIDYWFNVLGKAINLDFLWGITPENNRLALRFLRNIGAIKLGTMPNMLKNFYTGETVGGVIGYIERKDA